MTSKEFVLWLKGFTQGVHEFNITPKQWDILKDKLAEVNDDSTLSSFPFGVPNTAPFVTLPHITPGPTINPHNPYTITCSTGSAGTITTTPGHGSLTFNPSTSTTLWNPSGSNWSYTNGGNTDIK